MKRLVAATTLLLLLGCDGGRDPEGLSYEGVVNGHFVYRWSDRDYKVTCWIMTGTGMHCVPDWQLTPPAEK